MLGLYQIVSAAPAGATTPLDIPSRGGPALALYPNTFPTFLAGGIAVTGGVTTTKAQATVAIAAGMAVSGGVNKQIGMALAGGTAVSGNASRQIPVTLRGGIAVSGSLQKQVGKTLAGGIAITTTFSGPDGTEATTKTVAAVLADKGTSVVIFTTYIPE